MKVNISRTAFGDIVSTEDNSNEEDFKVFVDNEEVDLSTNDVVNDVETILKNIANNYSQSFFGKLFGKQFNDTVKEIIEKIHEVHDGYLDDDTCNNFDAVACDGCPDYDKCCAESQNLAEVPSRPSSIVSNEIYEQIHRLAIDYVATVVDANETNSDEVNSNIIDGLTEFGCWIYNK